MKTKEELNELKKEVQELNKKLSELEEEELSLVCGGDWDIEYGLYNANNPEHNLML